MSLPSVNITELDGALAAPPPTAGRLYAVIGVASSGPTNLPATFGRVRDLTATFGTGPGVEAAALYILTTGRPVVFVRTGQTTAATATGILGTGANGGATSGTAVITVSTPASILDSYEVAMNVVVGGVRGTPGIILRFSLDDGRTWGPNVALDVGVQYTIPGSGVTLAFATGTFVAGETWRTRTTAPFANSTEMGAALDALIATSINWEQVLIEQPLDAAMFDVVAAKFPTDGTRTSTKSFIASVRIPTIGETSAAYLSSVSTAFAAKETKRGSMCAGAADTVSAVSARSYLRPISHAVGARQGFVTPEQNIADVNLGGLPGVSIKDVNGNGKHHDELITPGLDDARFVTLRTFDGRAGVYVNRARMFSAQGSDFRLVPHRRVMNSARIALNSYFENRLNKAIEVNPTTGYILEREALEIEAGATEALRAVLRERPMASAVSFVLSRTDALLTTFTLTGQARVVPLAYAETINLDVGYTAKVA